VLALLVVSVLVFSGCRQENLLFFPERLPADFRFSFPGTFEEVFLGVDGAVLHALHFKAARPRGLVLYFHGNAGSLRTWGEIAPNFTARGYDLLIPDYRGFGKSTGRTEQESSLLEDAMAFYRHATRVFPEDRMVIYGRSIGTGIAAYCATRGRPRLLLLESPYVNLSDLASYHYPFVPRAILQAWLRYPLRTDRWISDSTCPVYLFHGDRDRVIPFRSSESLVALAGGKAHLIRVAGGGHNDLEDFERYRQALSSLLQ